MTTDRSDGVWDVLSDPSRRRILSELASGPCAVGELADRLPISRPAVSQHLRVLKDAGVVVDDVQGTRRVYRVDSAALTALKDQLDTFWQRALAGFSTVVEPAAGGRRERQKGREHG